MQKEQKQNEVDVLEQIADEVARLFVLHIDELNSLKNKNYESKIKK